jgi:hypothetical protein
VKELPVGFRVLDVEAILVEILSQNQIQHIRDLNRHIQNNESGKICCVMMYIIVESIDSPSGRCIYDVLGFDAYSQLCNLHKKASSLNVRLVELVKALNKE